MPSIHVYRRRRKRGDGSTYYEKTYTAQIRFGRKATFLRGTGSASEREAKRIAKEIAKRIEREELPKRGREVTTLDDLFGRWWHEHGKALKDAVTVQGRVARILQIIGADKPLSQIDDVTINDLVQAMYQQGASGATINRHLTYFRQAWRMAGKRWGFQVGDIDWTEHRQPEAKEKPIFLTLDEARALMAAAPEHIAIAIAWAIYTGCRLDEMQTLTWDKVHRDQRICWVWAKGGRYRVVLLSEVAMRILDYCANDPQPDNRVFNLRNRRKHWEKARAAIGRPDLRFHDLRHVNGTWLNQYSKADIRKIQHGLGHSDVATTTRYVHVHDDTMFKALDDLPDVTESVLFDADADVAIQRSHPELTGIACDAHKKND